MDWRELERTVGAIEEKIGGESRLDVRAYEDLLSMYKAGMDEGLAGYHERNRGFREQIVKAMEELIRRERYREVDGFNIQYRRSLLMDAVEDFDAYMLYVEADREPEKRFYLPRRGTLGPIARDMTRLFAGGSGSSWTPGASEEEEADGETGTTGKARGDGRTGTADGRHGCAGAGAIGELDLLTISLPPGVGKSTLALFFLSWLGGRNPDSPMLTFSHDAGIIRGFYDELLRILLSEEYLWHDVFPTVQVCRTNAKDLRIDLGKPSRFETYQFSSVGAGNAGKLRAAQLLYCDDLVESIEQAMSRERMDKLWTQYNTDIQQRKTGQCKELHIATRWSVWDVIGRLEAEEEESRTGRAKFIRIPAMNEKDESNFDYPGIHDKFTTAWYRRQRDSMDDVNWRALYMNEPIEREGQLYPEDELRRYFDVPGTEPDMVVAVCDTKAKGSDYCFLPVAVRYGDDFYVTDCVCDNGDPGMVEERLAQILVREKVQLCQFESNSAGWHIAEKVQKRVKELGGRCSISTKPTTANKETKIIANQPWVIQHCLFRDGSTYRRNTDYGRMMQMLTGYTVTAKNKHDDVPDGMAMLALYVQSLTVPKVTVMQRPW